MRSAPDRWVLGLVLAAAVALRFSFLVPGFWHQPWTPHHFDEHILPYEALALWEGVTPREVGWPASTVRLPLSAVYGVRMLWDQRAALASAKDPEDAFLIISRWSGDRVADAAPLYEIGRLVVAAFGVLQVVLAVFAARAWLGPRTMPIAAALAAISPVAVTHSQVVLADVAGACFASLLLVLLVRVSSDRSHALWLGIAAALATASKFHFGVWLLPAIAVCWLPGRTGVSRAERAVATLILLTGFTLTLLALVPWLWINPILGMKEFAGVALAKGGQGAGGVLDVVSHLKGILGGLGWTVIACAIPGLFVFMRSRQPLRIGAAVLVLAVTGLLAASAIVFDRYGLVVLPGVVLLATAGLDRMTRLAPRFGPSLVALLVLFVGLPQALLAVHQVKQRNSYHLAHEWMMAHLPNGASVVIYSEDNQYLPRSMEQLTSCVSYVWSDAAYREKLATNELMAAPDSGLPMRLAILNDEFFHAFWCSRERLTPQLPAFNVHRFHAGKRFQALDVATLRAEFVAGLTDSTRGFDAVLVHWPLSPVVKPAVTFTTEVGPTLQLYLRPGIVLRDAREH